MRKLLVFGAVGVMAMLVLLWRETQAQDVTPATPRSDRARAAPPTIVAGPDRTAPVAAPVAVVTPPPAAGSDDTKVNPNSDEFFDRFIERQPKVVSRAAMSCYRDRHLGMDKWIKLTFVGHIKSGEITFSDVKAKESRLDDPALESCMIAAVGNAHYHDDSLPDVDSYPDQTVLNPERGGKKYLHAPD